MEYWKVFFKLTFFFIMVDKLHLNIFKLFLIIIDI